MDARSGRKSRWLVALIAPVLLSVGSGCDSGRATLAREGASRAIRVAVDSRFLENASAPGRVVELTPAAAGAAVAQGRSGRLELLSASTTPTAVERARRVAGVSTHARHIPMDMEKPCVIKPGVYAIVDEATGQLVGVLIVYPDCRLEIVPAS